MEKYSKRYFEESKNDYILQLKKQIKLYCSPKNSSILFLTNTQKIKKYDYLIYNIFFFLRLQVFEIKNSISLTIFETQV